MIHVNGIGAGMAPKAIDSAATIGDIAPKSEAAKAADVVEISTVAKLAAKIHELPEVRTELVERVRAEIQAGTFETPERLDITIERLMEELFPTMQ